MIPMPATAAPLPAPGRPDISGLRCASFPDVGRYAAGFSAAACRQAWRERGGIGAGAPLAIRLNLAPPASPRTARLPEGYPAALEEEIALAAAAIGARPAVSRVHASACGRTLPADDVLARIDACLRSAFRFTADVDLSLELDACAPARRALASLRRLGFDRVSLRVRDRGAVRAARPLAEAARELGFVRLCVDLAFGLSRRPPAEVAATIREIAGLRPDRVTLSPREGARAAHAALPAAAVEALRLAGYEHVGLDDFALADDPLLLAKRQGRLHRDLQGFGLRPDGDVLALGPVATGRVGATRYQNALGLEAYLAALRRPELPVARGVALEREDLARDAVIRAIVCHGQVDFGAIDQSFLVEVRRDFGRELAALRPLVRDGLVEVDDEGLQLTPAGAWFAAEVATVFHGGAPSRRPQG
jgi:oxygen-independent coproporphyrinogen-3 oxidase